MSRLPPRHPSPSAQLLVDELRRSHFRDATAFRRKARGYVRLGLPAGTVVTDAEVDVLVSVCVATVLDAHDAEDAARVVAREMSANENEAFEAICDWTVRREVRRIRRLHKGHFGREDA
jgi:hypothetical protein